MGRILSIVLKKNRPLLFLAALATPGGLKDDEYVTDFCNTITENTVYQEPVTACIYR